MYLCTCIKSTDGRASGVDSNIYSNMLYHRHARAACRVELCSVRVYLFTSFWFGYKTSLKISSFKNHENTFMKDLIIYVSKKKNQTKMTTKPPSRVAFIKKTVNLKCWWEWGTNGVLLYSCEVWKKVHLLWETVLMFLQLRAQSYCMSQQSHLLGCS